ncbi:MAG: type II toxin-antitoxin system RelE/ParE family toxin [Elusimicrobia bacterium]|nr:type II toxin-antitoxin system RelE/ParE family toxin [Elusimicrobiota bacterium]
MPEFDSWLLGLSAKEQLQVDDRLDRIKRHSHFGDRKYLGEELFELRWRSGRRVYFALMVDGDGRIALMLLGGDKNGQKQDIARARIILGRETS